MQSQSSGKVIQPWIKFDIDNGTVESTILNGHFDYGKLKSLPRTKNKAHLKSI